MSKTTERKHQSKRKRCRYCRSLTDDIPNHYAKDCIQVAIAFDPDFWPYLEGSVEARNARNQRQNKSRAIGIGITVNTKRPNNVNEGFNNRASASKANSTSKGGASAGPVYRRTVAGTLILMAGSDVVLDDASQHRKRATKHGT